MKTIPAAMAVLLLVASSLAWSQTTRRDGNWWLGQETPSRIDYVIGFFDGMELGRAFSTWKLLNGTKSQQACYGESAAAYREYTTKYLGNVTVGQLRAGLDSFYSDYKNRRILLEGAVWLVLLGIAGTPEAELKQITESWRQNAGN